VGVKIRLSLTLTIGRAKPDPEEVSVDNTGEHLIPNATYDHGFVMPDRSNE
jgi:hypothetical protein